MSSFSPVAARQQIRAEIRRLRQALSSEQQQQAAQAAACRAMAFPPIQQAQKVALFLSFDGELDTGPLIRQLWQQGQQVYLPVLHPFSAGQLLFLRYLPETPLLKNRLGIDEPPLDIRQLATLDQLDVMLVPLVAFDATGQRLGMGGGFYDRTLQRWQQHGCLPVGIAHSCQQVTALPAEHWDIPLPALITPDNIWQWS
ncbi:MULTISPECIES: 5-formyltetrahydrofolate cyclo-ligase [unclassified Tatumella]|uniref:5-formyltetrahydrofolate cyclo-ligase n=1 Tax=unclassified Tatumella TaxID=2649542 RepID=UPI001BAEB41B|nr:5-formyltetrahydrofolate cyclo-ligase [Tatumella sp. JGM82]MBS0891914.1 5-formyltetrahydrofolate cyclo-ligase [Tatumella sp. JGM94]MBS0900576.1 5-formyltetrahydrofolate cyclo-ligase [Tatumella sp. JGM100]